MSLPPSGWEIPKEIQPTEEGATVGPDYLTIGGSGGPGLHDHCQFRLPDPKKFDADVQSRLRAVLGVLQTPLDDHFLERVKEEWSRWFSARHKPGERPKLKVGSPLDKDLNLLKGYEAELARVESEYREFEKMIERSGKLEISARDLRR